MKLVKQTVIPADEVPTVWTAMPMPTTDFQKLPETVEGYCAINELLKNEDRSTLDQVEDS